MEGTWPVVLLEPTAETVGAEYGDRTPGAPTRHTGLWATRRDRGGGERVDAGLETGEWTVLWEIRSFPSIADCDTSWTLEQEGVVWDIEQVNLAHRPGGERRLQLLTMRHQ